MTAPLSSSWPSPVNAGPVGSQNTNAAMRMSAATSGTAVSEPGATCIDLRMLFSDPTLPQGLVSMRGATDTYHPLKAALSAENLRASRRSPESHRTRRTATGAPYSLDNLGPRRDSHRQQSEYQYAPQNSASTSMLPSPFQVRHIHWFPFTVSDRRSLSSCRPVVAPTVELLLLHRGRSVRSELLGDDVQCVPDVTTAATIDGVLASISRRPSVQLPTHVQLHSEHLRPGSVIWDPGIRWRTGGRQAPAVLSLGPTRVCVSLTPCSQLMFHFM